MHTYFAIALDRRGRTIGSVGPYFTRGDAEAAIRAAHPAAYSYSVGYGSDGPYFDIRNTRNA
jgi:hypothetical protein